MMMNWKFWFGVYVVCVLLANYTAETFIQLPFFGLLAVGTLIFGVTFTARDYVHHAGKKIVYTMIFTAAVLSVLMSIYLGVPLRIVAASFIAIVLAETADTEIYQRYISDSWMVRVFKSNLVSIPLDTILFTAIAFLGVFPTYDLAQIIFADIVYKSLIGVAVATFRYVPQLNLAHTLKS